MTSFIISLLPLIAFALIIVLYKLAYDFNYWKKRGVPSIKPLPLVGNFLNVFTLRTTIGSALQSLYNQTDRPFFGIYVLNRPILIIKSPELIKLVLVKEFNSFHDRNILLNEQCDPITGNMLFVMKNPQWRRLRSKITPLYTSAKLKIMSPLVHTGAQNLRAYLDRNLQEEVLDAKDVCTRYSTDVICSCAFGLDARSFDSGHSKFMEVGKKMIGLNLRNILAQVSYFMVPVLARVFMMPFMKLEYTSYMQEVFSKTIVERERTKETRNDMIDIMTEMMNSNEFSLDRVALLAQPVQFFIAGLETTSTTMAFALHELCVKPEIQTKLREEIQKNILEFGGLTYEAIKLMPYLDMVLDETLRKYPIFTFLDRMCMNDFQIPDSNVVIEKGTPVFVPVLALHHDPKYFPDPEKFDPERFSNDESKEAMVHSSYLPFGDGPRKCIGERFGRFTAKLGLAQMIAEFEVVPCPKTREPVEFETMFFLLSPHGGLPMKFKKL